MIADDYVDIKSNNILLDYEGTNSDGITVRRVQISDLEDAVMLALGKNLQDCISENQLWRSPEPWTRARQNIASDIFPFGIMAINLRDAQEHSALAKRGYAACSSCDEAWRPILQTYLALWR